MKRLCEPTERLYADRSACKAISHRYKYYNKKARQLVDISTVLAANKIPIYSSIHCVSKKFLFLANDPLALL